MMCCDPWEMLLEPGLVHLSVSTLIPLQHVVEESVPSLCQP
jgi:hypothetical protein